MGKSAILVLGLVLAVLGGVGLAMGGVPYKDTDTLFSVGDIEANVETQRSFRIPPIASGILLAGGVGLLVFGAVKKS